MGRRPLAESLERRAALVYQRVQALARNDDYCADIGLLREKYGLRFENGLLADIPVAAASRLTAEISAGSGLSLPVLPEYLKALTLDELKNELKNELKACLVARAQRGQARPGRSYADHVRRPGPARRRRRDGRLGAVLLARLPRHRARAA